MFKSLLYLAIFSATVVASWVGFSLYHGYTTSTISSNEAVIITPIPSGFDREVIEIIKQKKAIKVNLTDETIDASEQQATAAASEQQATSSAQQL